MKFFTTPTGFSAVPPDCLHEIFQYLENDMISLYRCMLVNRIWCRIVIPLLWRCPFEYSEHKSRKYFELIRTYIDCLPKSAKERIRETGCNLPLNTSPLFPYHDYLKELDCQSLNEAVKEWTERSELNRLEDLDDVICETGYNTSPFLPYHDYLRKPDCQKLDKDVEEWTKLNQCPEDPEDSEDPEDPEDLIYAELLKLLLSRRKGLWRLRLGQYGNKYHFPLISEVPCMKYTLSNLRRFEFLGDIDHLSEPGLDNLYEFLVKLSSIANNIEYMDIDTGEDEITLSGIGLQKLILSQKNLLGFRYTQENSKVENSKAFIKTLSSNANTLKNVEFVYLPLNEQCLSPLKKFNNLESMQFLYCYDNDIFGETEEVLEASPSQLKVKKLIFHKGQLSLVTLEILRLANTSVRELTVDNVVPGLFKVISENCPNIEYLAAAISQKTFESLAYLSTSKVEHLVLKTLDNRDIETKDFQQLGKCLSLSLRHLSLDFNTSVEELSSFLTECQSPLKSLSLKLGITTDDMNRDEYLKVVMEFAKKNESLKELKISLYDISSDKHKKSFDDIEAKDIFTKDILSKAQLLVPNISKETHKPFTCPQAS